MEIEVTAPGLLTVETTGSTDTLGFVTSGNNEIARMDGGGSGNNFKLYVPVVTGSYSLYVDGHEPLRPKDPTHLLWTLGWQWVKWHL